MNTDLHWTTILPPPDRAYYARMADCERGVMVQVCRRRRWDQERSAPLPALVGEFVLDVPLHVARDRVMAMLCEVGENEVLV